MHVRLTLQQLHAFTALAQLGSFRETALQAGISQPALSRMIQMMEARVGVRLFDRDTHRVTPTPAGQKLLPLATVMLRDYEASFRAFEDYVGGQAGTIRIAVLPSIAATLLPGAVAAFGAANPTIRFELWEDVGAPVHRAVKEGQVDFGIAPPPADGDLAFRPLFDDELVLIARRGDPLLDCASHDWTVFADHPYVALSGETGLRRLVDEALAAARITARPLFECKQPTTLAAFVAAGVGIAALSRLTLAQVANAELGSCRLTQPTCARRIGIVTHVRRSPSPATRLFVKELMGQARRFPAGGLGWDAPNA